jgi:membrane protein YqaA with SNARE-associated domain
LIDRLAALARSRRGLVLVAAWACAEAVLLPVVPDVIVLPLVAAAPRATPRLVGALLTGALVGSVFLVWLVLADPDRVRSLFLVLPGLDAATIRGAEADIATNGAAAFAAFGPGVPVKVDTLAWVTAGGSPLVLAAAVALNRLTRIGPGIILAAIVGRLAPQWLRRHEWSAIAGYVAGWVALYLVYWRVV